MKKDYRNTGKRFISLCIALYLVPVYTLAETIEVVSDDSWRSTDNVANVGACPGVVGSPGPAWTEHSFDDSAWRFATIMDQVPPWFGVPPNNVTGGFYIWDCPPLSICNGTSIPYGPLRAYLRKAITIDNDIISAQVELSVDDDYQLYINGVLAHQDLSGGASDTPWLDVSSYLNVGNNIIAIHAWDGGGVGSCTTYERGANQAALKLLVETKDTLNVDIDIKPGSDPNSINLCSKGTVPVAILGSDLLSVYDIDTSTLSFADAGVKMAGKKDPHSLCSVEEVNADVYDDLVCHFVTFDIAALDGSSTTATVSGELFSGTSIEGEDSVRIVKDTCK